MDFNAFFWWGYSGKVGGAGFVNNRKIVYCCSTFDSNWTLVNFIVKALIEDCAHHSGHWYNSTGADWNQHGFWGTPNFLPWWISISVITCITWVMIPSGSFSPKRLYSIQVLVVKINPNGTGRSRAVISWRFAPLLPNKALSFALPSVNSQTDFFRKPYILIMKVKLFRLKMDYQNLRICQKN